MRTVFFRFGSYSMADEWRADGCRVVYETSLETIIRRLDQYPKGFRYEADPQGLLFVGAQNWARRLALAVEQAGFRVELIEVFFQFG